MIPRRGVCVATFMVVVCLAVGAQSIAWRTDLGAAFKEAQSSNKMVMVDVYTDWCNWCKKLDSDTYTDSRVIEALKNFIPLKLNPESSSANQEFASSHGVSGYPTILLLEPDRTVANKIVGYMDGPTLTDTLLKTLQYETVVKRLLAEYRAGNFRHSAELLAKLMELGRVEEARPVFDVLRKNGSLSAAAQEGPALAIARGLVDGGEYEQAVLYLTIVESASVASDNTRDARLLHSIVIFYTRGKAAGLEYLSRFMKEPATPESWRQKIQDLSDAMRDARDPKGS